MREMLLESIRNLFRKPSTLRYPEEPSPPPENYRGLIVYKRELCIFCTKCELVCPPGAIRFTYHGDGEKEFHYNPYLCIFCGECVRACPKPGCLVQVDEVPPVAAQGEVPDWERLEKFAENSKREWLRAGKKQNKK